MASVTASLLTDSSSVASVDSTGVHYVQMENAGENSGEKSDSDTVVRCKC